MVWLIITSLVLSVTMDSFGLYGRYALYLKKMILAGVYNNTEIILE
ncbi:MAG: hypothetical protein QG574_295 [Cyanobacteriota bacterium erpe_2018_sw_21hr_WHONDRS-SW48-000092_B_bin.40]|jgi:hypothetical protein|nr:hypothetical protein [Cyanobacteriota bacterium erpe_2018_sw_21hr_WHONDRS-SW48-000092_B_bin.40]